MLCRNALRILCLVFVFPVQVSSRSCWVCSKKGTAENIGACLTSPDPLAPPCTLPDAWCAIFRDKRVLEHGTIPFVVSQRCTVDGEIPADQRQKDKFCGQVDGLEMCACNKDKCNLDSTCTCETKPKEEPIKPAGTNKPKSTKYKEPEPKDKPKLAPSFGNMVVVGWENVFACACVFVFQFLY